VCLGLSDTGGRCFSFADGPLTSSLHFLTKRVRLVDVCCIAFLLMHWEVSSGWVITSWSVKWICRGHYHPESATYTARSPRADTGSINTAGFGFAYSIGMGLLRSTTISSLAADDF
jgi:hypothetical protein